MPCNSCHFWLLQRKRVYSDGTQRIYFQVVGGKGLCEKLKIETAEGFGCIDFKDDPSFDHIIIDKIEGAPWQHWKMGPCPDCQGRGSGTEGGACGRCAGTGNVRYYEDGHIGDERTRRHPLEPATEITHADPGTIIKPLPKASVL